MHKTFFVAPLLLIGLSLPASAGTDKDYTYLALGDSVPFGMDISKMVPFAANYPTSPSVFVGYPEAIADDLHLAKSKKEVNAACPGETSASFLDNTQPDYGCSSPHIEPGIMIPPFRSLVGLKVYYPHSQMQFALGELATNKHINLVTLSIGANDVLLHMDKVLACGDNTECVVGVLTPIMQDFAAHLGLILGGIRSEYNGTLIVSNYYSPAPLFDPIAAIINNVITQVAAGVSAAPGFAPIQVADTFTAFKAYGNDACAAGLLIPLPFGPNPCDIHPSKKGRDVIAGVIEKLIP
jgi:hypothetical protein